MNLKPISKLNMIIAIIVFTMLVACTSSSGTQAIPGSESPEKNGNPAMVDSVTIEQRDKHFYAVINGFYPDACTYVSSVDQVVKDNTINIRLLTDRPAEVMCATMLTPFTVDILLTIGGLMPQEYTVVVNEGPSTTLLLE